MNIKLYAAIALTVLALSACKQDTAPADAATDTAPAATDVVEPAIEGATDEQMAPATDAPPLDPVEAQAAVEAAADEAAKMVEEQAAEAADQQ